MDSKRAFEALLDELMHAYGHSIGRYGNNRHERLVEAKAAVLAAYKAAAQPATFKPTGNPELDTILLKPDPAFDAFVASLPANYWARYDLSAVRLGWHHGRAGATVHINELDDALQAAADERDDAAGREGQPVAWMNGNGAVLTTRYINKCRAISPGSLSDFDVPLFTHPAPKADAAADGNAGRICPHGVVHGTQCNDCVICPGCCHQFPAIPVNVQKRLFALDAAADVSAWWTLVMGAAAALEDATHGMRDPDAKRAAEGAARHYRAAAKALAASPARGGEGEKIRAVVADCQEHFLKEYRANKTSYREGKSDAGDFILARVDAAVSREAQ